MKSYGEYKAGDTLLLSEIPAHWKPVKLRHILKPFSKKNYPQMQLLSVVRDRGVIKRNVYDKKENHNYIPSDLSGYKLVREGQFVVNKMKAWQGSYGVSNYDGIVSPAYFVFDVILDINSKFFNRAIRSRPYISSFGRFSDGIRVDQWDLSMQKMKEIIFFVPPRDEQDQIVRFLDWKVSGINALINIRKKKIRQLEAFKKAVINRAVTRGIGSSNVKLEETGVNWLGETQSDWKVVRLKQLVKVRKDKDIYSPSSETNYIALENIKSYSNKLFETETEYASSVQSVCCRGDLLFGKLRPYLAKVIISPIDGFCTGELLVISSFDGDMRFLRYVMLHEKFIDFVNASTYGAKMPRVDAGYILNMSIPYPSLQEQTEIANYLDEQCNLIDEMQSNIEKIIANLHDFKTRLIADVVTGKIDVRGIDIPEYETVEEIEDAFDEDPDDEFMMEEEED